MQAVTIKGVTCEACVKLITKRITKLPGVQEVISQSPSGVFAIQSARPLTTPVINQALEGTDYQVIAVN